MARYSSKRGPSSDFSLTDVFQTIPGCEITRYFDEGELLILFQSCVQITGAGPLTVWQKPFIDSLSEVPIGEGLNTIRGTSGQKFMIGGHVLYPVSSGYKTISLRARVFEVATGALIRAGTGRLTVIQLPLWDGIDDIFQPTFA